MQKFLSLRGKMLIFTFGIVAVLMGLSLAVIHRFVAGQVQDRVGGELEKTQSVFRTFMQERALWLRSQCEVVAEDPRFTALLDIQAPDLDTQSRTVLREARRFQNIIGSDLFLVTNRDGRVLARLEVSASPGGELNGLPTLAPALKGTAAAGRWQAEERDYGVATVPIREGEAVVGTVSIGFTGAVDAGPFLEDLAAVAEGASFRPLLSGDREGVAELARDFLGRFGCDLAAITDGRGGTMGLALRAVGSGEDLSGSPTIQEALGGGGTMGLQVDRGRIVQVVALPVWSQDEIVGVLSTGFGIDDRVARNLKAMMHSEVSFALDGRVVASTWPEEVRQVLARELFAPESPFVDRTDPFDVTVGRETYLSLLSRMEDLRGGARGFYLIQFSLDQAIGFLTTIERVLLVIGGGVLLAAALISFLGVARMTRPITALVEGTRRLAAGQLVGDRIPVDSRDEIGELAESFNDMAEALTRSRDALAESERSYRDLFDNAQDIVYTTDLDMRLTSLNKAALELWSYSSEELLGKSFYDLLSPEDAQRLRETDRLHPPGTPRPVVEVGIVGKEGKRAGLEVVSRWIMEGGKPVGLHGIGRDVTERKEREAAMNRFREQLHEAEKLRALGEMAAGIAHNFNNLLTGVVGYAELMKLSGDIPDHVLENAKKIVESGQRCSAIVRRIQTFGRPTDVTQVEPVDLNRVIRDTVEITRPKWKSAPEREGRTVRIALELGDIPSIQSSGSAWEEILSNLIFNAVDAMPEGGTLTLGTRQEEGQIVVTVSDTGTGMDEETRRRVFEPFFTTKDPDRGTGLGLSTVWGLVQGQGGQVDIESAPGEGTTFTTRVPAAPASEGDAEEEGGVETLSGLRILAIDDDLSVREFLPRLLPGHEVDTAADGMEGLEKFHQGHYDLVVCDWVMTGMSGLEVAEQIKQRAPQTAVVLMTGWEFKGTAVDQSSAIDLIFPKPFDAEKLNRALSEAVRLRDEQGSAEPVQRGEGD